MVGLKRGFTMIELSVVGAVVAIIALMIVPRLAQAQDDSRVAGSAAALRDMARTFELFSSSNGYWPPEIDAAQMPPEMRSLFSGDNPFLKPCPIGGVYDYDNPPNAPFVAITIRPTPDAPPPTITDAQALDAALDDGVLSTGNFRSIGNGAYTYAFSRK